MARTMFYVLLYLIDHIEFQAMTISNGKPLITEQAYPRVWQSHVQWHGAK